SRTVTYRRGSLSVDLPATPGHSEYEQVDEGGFTQRSVSQDFCIRPADLVLNSVAVLPAAGDMIEDGDDVYEVMAVPTRGMSRGSKLQPYERRDRHTLRVHCKKVAAATATVKVVSVLATGGDNVVRWR